MPSFRYATSQIIVHWVAAAAIIFLLITGTFVLSEMPNTLDKLSNLRIHMVVGALVASLIIARIVLRRRKPFPPQVKGQALARAGHTALNLVGLLLVASGVVLAVESGALQAVLGSGRLPDDFFDFTPRKVHGIASKVLMGLIALHILAALYHQLIVKDRLLARMGLKFRR